MAWTRRQILTSGLTVAGSVGLAAILRKISGLSATFPPSPQYPVRLLGPSSAAGHRLRDGFRFPSPFQEKRTDVLIIGGGIAGLSAGWRLQKKGVHNFKILELEEHVGGNSRSGENSISKYPWGAHYVTLLNPEATFARELFEDFGIITDQRAGDPTYNDYYLCQAPHERLYIYKKWQEGLLPKIGTSAQDEKQAKDFFAHVEELRMTKGTDGRFAFTIPLALSSEDSKFRDLDQETMAAYLNRHGWISQPLHWYINYCCRDDYGTPHDQVSAWAGLHYFCSRRGRADGIEGSSVITWPEGNGWLVAQLQERLKSQIVTNAMALNIEEHSEGVTVDVWDETLERVTRWNAKSVIVAIPRFVAAHLGPRLRETQAEIASQLSYSPWMVANVTLSRFPKASTGAPIAWDNVFYDGSSLGYVVATHQQMKISTGATVWTYYRPLDQRPPSQARTQAQTTSAETWRAQIISDLCLAHPGIEELITSMDIWVWGHAFVRPTAGFMFGDARRLMQKNLGRIYFAHSDMSGISIFEEANYHGVTAADGVIKNGLS